MQLRFKSLAGDVVLCDLPSGECPEAAQLINDAATKLAFGFRSQRRARGSAGLTEWLRPLAYQLISVCLDGNLQHLLYRRSLKAKRYQRGDVLSSNSFQLGLMAIFSEDYDQERGNQAALLDKEDRYELGQMLWYAYRHYVPPCFINGFATQIGPITKQRSEHGIEPEFSEWIIERRVMDVRANNPRGSYPDHIERDVQKLRSESAGVLGSFFQALSDIHSEALD